MAQTYTLDEAAARLALPTEEFKRRLKDEWKQIRSFRDGPTLRFRSADIDELSRVMGEMSDPGLQLGPVGAGDLSDPGGSSDDFVLSPDLPAAPPPSSKVGKPKPGLKPADDSGVKLDPPAALRPADSEISLPTEDIALDLSGPGSSIIRPSQLGKLPPPKPSGIAPKPSGILPKPSGKFATPPSSKLVGPPGSKGTTGADSSSEFELSLDADSDSFEMELADDKSQEMDLGGLELGPTGDAHGGLSGINLGKPTDSGLSLEAGGPKTGGLGQPRSSKILPRGAARTGGPKGGPQSGSSADFELALDSGSSAGGRGVVDSDSEFELSLEGGSPGADTGPKTAAPHAGDSDGEVFATDFELPAVGDDSEAELVVGDDLTTEHSSSDFDLAISDADVGVDGEDSASEVVLVDDEAVVDDYGDAVAVEEDGADYAAAAGAGAALMGVGAADEDGEAPVRYVPAAPSQWGVLPVVVLLPSLLLVFVGGLMSFELLRGMWGYHQPSKPSSMLLRTMADTFGMKVSD